MKRWTDDHTDLLRQLYAKGQSDADIARILDFSANTVLRKRRQYGLGPPLGKPGPTNGSMRHTPETIARMRAYWRARWETDEAYRAKASKGEESLRERMARARQIALQNRWRAPPKGSPELRLYRKHQAILGTTAARAALECHERPPIDTSRHLQSAQ
jgi:hypothetical protein